MKNILFIVDPQNDYITGTMAVPGAEEKMMKLAKHDFNKYDCVLITLDSYSENNPLFKENGGDLPKHCIEHTDGRELPEYLAEIIQSVPYFQHFEKRHRLNSKEKSIFDSEHSFNLQNQIKQGKFNGGVHVDICGINRDYCVLETIKELRKYLNDEDITVLINYVASSDEGNTKLNNYLKSSRIKCE